MSAELKREALAVLGEVCKLSPDIRLGQLLAHLGFLRDAHVGRGFGDIEDDELLAVLYRHRAELLTRLEGDPVPSPQDAAAATSVSGSPIAINAPSAVGPRN